MHVVGAQSASKIADKGMEVIAVVTHAEGVR